MSNYRQTTNLAEVRQYLGKAAVVGFDFETAPDQPHRKIDRAALDPHMAHIVGVSFSAGEGDGIYIPVAHRSGGNADISEVIKLIAEFAANAGIIKVAHNLAFEAMFLYKHGIVLQPPCYDTLAAAQMTLKEKTIFRSLTDSGLKSLVSELFCVQLPTFTDVTVGKHFDELNPLDSETIRYACADSDYALQLYHIFNKWFDCWMPRHRWLVENIESLTAEIGRASCRERVSPRV
jgi:DNA polymerase-1